MCSSPMLGESYSAQTISNITRQLDTACSSFIAAHWRMNISIFFWMAIVLKVRDTARKVRRRMILVAYGVTRHRPAPRAGLSVRSGRKPSAWKQFLQDLFLRGLEGKTLQLIISDGGKGLQAALPSFPQRAGAALLAHKLRNIADKISRQEGSCVAGASAIYSCQQPKRSPTGLPRLEAALAASPPQRGGLCGARSRRAAKLFRRPASPLDQGAHHQRQSAPAEWRKVPAKQSRVLALQGPPETDGCYSK